MENSTKRELELEQAAKVEGHRDFERTVSKAMANSSVSTTYAGHKLMTNLLTQVSAALKSACEDWKPSRHKKAEIMLADLVAQGAIDYDVMALIGLRVVIDRIGYSKTSLISVASAIAFEISARRIDSKVIETSIKRINSRSMAHKSRALHGLVYSATKKGQIQKFTWEKGMAAQIGVVIMEAIMTTGLVDVRLVTSDGKDMYTVHPSIEFLKQINKVNDQCGWRMPHHLPMICPPKEWTNLQDGGYLSFRYPLVRGLTEEHRAVLETHMDDIQPVLSAINTIQQTKFRINKTVLKTMRALYDSHSPLCDIPTEPDINLLRCPKCGEIIEPRKPGDGRKSKRHECFDDPAILKLWKPKASVYYSSEAAYVSKSLAFLKIITTAERFKDEEALWFPWSLDYRGRMYPMTDYLQPQGSDQAKGLLEFAEGKTVDTPEAREWLMRTGAGLIWKDKMSVDEQLDRVEKATPEIISWAEAPLDNLGWAEADSPWEALAWAVDYAGYIKDPQGYLSHAVCTMDGTCNGLQHLSLLLKDPIGGAEVNLGSSTRDQKPHDIYQLVCNTVVGVLKERLAQPDKMIDVKSKDKKLVRYSYSEHDMITRWFAVGIERKTCKRPVMVVPYSGTYDTVKESLDADWLTPQYEKFMKKLEVECEGIKDPIERCAVIVDRLKEFPFLKNKDKDDHSGVPSWMDAQAYLASVIWEAIHVHVPAAVELMKALKRLGTAAGNSKCGMLWKAPSGWWVQHTEFLNNDVQVKTTIGDAEVYLTMATKSEVINGKKQGSSAAPNYIHSMDAATLVRTVNACGLMDYAMVHDSYGVHACDAYKLAKALRQQVFEIYSEDNTLLKDLWDMTYARIGSEDKIEMPQPGSYDIKEILGSLYFFA